MQLRIQCECDDPAGSRYATSLRDYIAKSPRFTLAATPGSNDFDVAAMYKFVLYVDTLDAWPKQGAVTAIGWTLVSANMYVMHSVQVCSEDTVKRRAESTIAQIDGVLDHVFSEN